MAKKIDEIEFLITIDEILIKYQQDTKNRQNSIEIDEDNDVGFLTTQKSKTGNFVRWSDIQEILNDLS